MFTFQYQKTTERDIFIEQKFQHFQQFRLKTESELRSIFTSQPVERKSSCVTFSLPCNWFQTSSAESAESGKILLKCCAIQLPLHFACSAFIYLHHQLLLSTQLQLSTSITTGDFCGNLISKSREKRLFKSPVFNSYLVLWGASKSY